MRLKIRTRIAYSIHKMKQLNACHEKRFEQIYLIEYEYVLQRHPYYLYLMCLHKHYTSIACVRQRNSSLLLVISLYSRDTFNICIEMIFKSEIECTLALHTP